MRDFVTILTFAMLITAFTMMATTAVSVANGVEIVGWRRLWSTRLHLFGQPRDLAPEAWRQVRGFHPCLFGATSCFTLQTIILRSLT